MEKKGREVQAKGARGAVEGYRMLRGERDWVWLQLSAHGWGGSGKNPDRVYQTTW